VRIGRLGKSNDMGNVEGLIGHAQHNFMAVITHPANWQELNYFWENASSQDSDWLID
jgi:hypothetical protein